MADAVSRMTRGKSMGAFCMQHGPGAENAYGGVAQAFADSIPILVVPQGYARKNMYLPYNFNSTLQMRGISKHCEPDPDRRRGAQRAAPRVHAIAQWPPAARGGRSSLRRIQ